MENDNLQENLEYACSLFPSIAHTCRKIGINRQQFNKYLSGIIRPSRHNMHKICNFFGVTESEILSEPSRFAEIMSVRRTPESSLEASPLSSALKRMRQLSGSLDRYCGFYFGYSYSFSNPGKVIRSLIRLSRTNSDYVWKFIEREKGPNKSVDVYKYEGSAFLLRERINVIMYDALQYSSISQIMLYPSYEASIDCLLGVHIGGPVKRGRKPGAARFLQKYLGSKVDVKLALSQCGLFDPEEIDPKILNLIGNEVHAPWSVLEVDET